MAFYTPSVAPSVVSQPASQALVLAGQGTGMHYPTTIPTGRNSYAYGGSYMQPAQYGYPQTMPVYVQPQHQVVYANGYPSYSSQGYGYGMPMTTQYMPGMGGPNVIVQQDPYGYRKHRSRRHRRHSHSGYYRY